MSLAYIRDYYGVPARRGGRVRFDGRDGTIVGAQAQYLRVRLDGDRRPRRRVADLPVLPRR